jgi:hypothetical protein
MIGNSIDFEEYLIKSLNTGFKNLTHLTLDFNNYYKVFSETFIEKIVINLPKLQNLIIKNPLNVTKGTADVLSRLSKLETLELYIWKDSKLFKNQIMKNCRKIKSIKL